MIRIYLPTKDYLSNLVPMLRRLGYTWSNGWSIGETSNKIVLNQYGNQEPLILYLRNGVCFWSGLTQPYTQASAARQIAEGSILPYEVGYRTLEEMSL
jgi:hypothetical protein